MSKFERILGRNKEIPTLSDFQNKLLQDLDSSGRVIERHTPDAPPARCRIVALDGKLTIQSTITSEGRLMLGHQFKKETEWESIAGVVFTLGDNGFSFRKVSSVSGPGFAQVDIQGLSQSEIDQFLKKAMSSKPDLKAMDRMKKASPTIGGGLTLWLDK